MSTKVIDIFNTLNFVSDYNSVGLTSASNRLTVNNGGLLTIFNTTQSQNSSVGALVIQNGGLSINALTNATSVSSGGALTVAGGASIAGDLIVGGTITYTNAEAASNTFAYLTLTSTDESTDIANGSLITFGGISVQSVADATSSTSGGAMTLAGGLAVNKSLFVGGISNLQNVIGTNTTLNNLNVINEIATSITTTSLLVTGSSLNATFNSNTIGSIFTTGGNVGLGTGAPATRLDINGTFRVNDRANISFNSNTLGNLFTTGGNVGIGTGSPTANFRLDINGSLRANGSAGVLHTFIGSNNSDIVSLQNTNASGGSSIRLNNNSGTNQGAFGFNNANASIFQNSVYVTSSASIPINIAAGNRTSNPVIFNASDNSVSITATTDAADTSSGALKVSGGVGIVGDLYVGGEVIVNSPLNVSVNNTRFSSNASTGSMQLIGGLSIDIRDTTNSNATSYTRGGGITLNGGLSVAQDTFLGGVLDIRGGSNNMNPLRLQSLQISSNFNNGASTVIQSGDSARTANSFTPIAFSGWNDQSNPKLTINTSNITIPSGIGLNATNNSNTLGNIFTTGGSVGIGTSSPSTLGILTLNGPINNITSGPHVLIKNSGNTLPIFHQLNWNNDNISLNFDSYYDGTSWRTSNTNTAFQIYKTNNRLNFNYVTGSAGSAKTFTSAMAIGSTGNISIGTTNPSTLLTVNGAISAGNVGFTALTTGTLNATGITATNINFTGDLFKNGTLYVSSQWLGTNGNILYYGTTGSGYLVGIGTSNPTTSLDVVGSIRASTSVTSASLFSTNQTTTNGVFTNLSAGTSNLGNLTAGNINFTGTLSQNGSPYIGSQWTGTSGTLYYGTAGSSLVGINTTNPQYTLDVNGTIRTQGLIAIGTAGSLNSTTGQYVIGSLSITNTTNVSSFTQGGGLSVAGGLAVGKSMAVGQSISLGGISNDIVGTFNASNNISTPTAIAGLLFPTANIRSFSINIQIQLLAGSGANNLYAYYTIDGIQNTAGWAIDDTFIGDNTGINFSIDNTGQLYYTSTNIANWISCTFTYKATSYSISGNYLQPAPATSGNFLVTQNLTVQGTTDASSASYGSIVTAGGVGIGKNVNVGGSVILNNVCATSSGTFDALNGPITNGNITGLTFSSSNYRSFSILMSVSVNRSAGGNLNAQFTIEGIQRDAGWYIYVSTLGDSIDISFNITAAGQLQYSTSTTYSNWTSTKFNYQVTAIYTTGGFNTFTFFTGINTINDILNITNSTESTSNSTGALTVSGGVGISKTLNVGNGVNTPNVNLGISSIFSGSFIAANNVSSATNVSGLIFSTTDIRYFESKIVVTVTRTDNSTLDEILTIRGNNNDSGWQLFIENIGDTSGIVFTITSTGQIQYTSSNITNFSSSIFRYSCQQYTKTGVYTSIPNNTRGSYIMDSIQVTNTSNAVYGSNVGALNVLGGVTIEKDVVSKGKIYSYSFSVVVPNNNTSSTINFGTINTGVYLYNITRNDLNYGWNLSGILYISNSLNNAFHSLIGSNNSMSFISCTNTSFTFNPNSGLFGDTYNMNLTRIG